MPTTILDGETYEQARHRRLTEEAKVIEKIQQDEIIRMAREAGFETEDWANGTHVIAYELGREIDITNELERFAALVREDDAERIAILEQDNANCRKAVSDLMDELQNHSGESADMVQEPVAVYAFRRKGLDDFCTCDERRYLELSEKPNLFETAIFYTTPPTAALPVPEVQWRDLTDEEIELIDKENMELMGSVELYRAVIAKFKEKQL